jgi:hypothetical protein
VQVHAVMVETQNTSIGLVIDQQRLDLPLKARKVTDLIYLVDRRRAPSRRSGGDRQRAPRNERGSLQMLALMQDDGTRGNGRPEYRYSWFGWAMKFASTGTAMAQAATICDAAQFIEAQIHAAVRLACGDFGDFPPSSTRRNPGAVCLKGAAVWPGSSTRSLSMISV